MRPIVVHALKISAGALAVFIVLGSATLGGLAYYFRESFYPGIRVAGVSARGLDKDTVQKTIAEKTTAYANHAVVVTLPDLSQPRNETTGVYPDVEIKTTAGELGLQFQSEAAIDSAWGIGRQKSPLEWTKSVVPVLFSPKTVALPYNIDESKVRTFIDTQVTPKIGAPTPAKLRVDGETVVIDDAKPGLTVDTESLSRELLKVLPSAMDGGKTTYLKAPTSESLSPITRSTLQPLADTLERLGSWPVTLLKGEEKIQPKKANILAWYSPIQGEDGTLSLSVDTKAVTDYLKSKGGSNLKLADSTKAVSDALTNQLKTIESQSVSSKPLASTQVALVIKPEDPKPQEAPDSGNYQLGRYPGKYVEVSLKDQKLYRIEGETLVATYTVSTGKWSTPTPKGTFTIRDKVSRAYSRSFGLYMPYWMNFVGTTDSGGELPTGSYGLHELPEWPNGYKEGQSHLGTPVSHGCVRLGVGDAAEVYGWADVGTPVVIHQ